MIRAYEAVINADKKLVNGEIFNAGWENKSVNPYCKRREKRNWRWCEN